MGSDPLDERTDAYWLQAGPWFADVRHPRPGYDEGTYRLDKTQGFSGRTSVEGTVVTWTHDIDTITRPPGHVDRGFTRFSDGYLVEWGEGYEEWWRQLARPGAPCRVWTRNDADRGQTSARLVQVGDLAASVWGGTDAGAVLFERAAEDGDWTTKLTVGSQALSVSARHTLMSGELADGMSGELTDGWRAVELGATFSGR